MFSVALTSSTFSSLFDHLQQWGMDAYDRMQSDWTATAYWGGVWACGFVVTFLLIRMMFTHWGDRDVTKKTIWLSLLVHALLGMLSTTVIFPNVRGQAGSEEGDGVVRHVAVVHEHVARGELDGQEGLAEEEGQAPGRSPAWEQAPRFASQARRAELPGEQTDDEEISLEKQPTNSELLTLTAPDVGERPNGDEPVPEPDRAAAKLNAAAEPAQPEIAEETAEARPDAGAGAAAKRRSDRGGSEGAAGPIARRTRPVNPEALPIAIDAERDLPEPAAGEEAALPIADAHTSAAPRRSERGAPGAAPVDEPSSAGGAEESPARATGSKRSFTRMGRPAGRAPDSALPATRRPAVGAAPELSSLTPGGTGALPGASAPASGGEGAADSIVPELLKSNSGGAINKNGGKVPATYRLRSSPQRKKFAIDMGANEESEEAVEASLRWLAAHQHPRGYWEPIEATLGTEPETTARFTNPQERQRSGLQSHTGLTALAVLAFLGKGYTHEDNEYADNVDRALAWLVAQQDAQGFLGGKANQYARMYCHGMATIALGEAYGMTKDPALREPLSRAVEFIVSQQYPDGSWRYADWRRLTTREGDMSMFGWQLMALKSARTAGLEVPTASMNRAIDFLIAQGDHLKSRGLSQHGGLAAYRLGERPKPSMTAECLFCKQMLGIKRTNRAATEAVNYLLQNLPQRSKQDLYYWYYGTLAMYHHGGDAWRRWNEALRDQLVADQRTDGDFAGSWNPRAPWGDYGGRVFSTALATLSLEVYYRFLPLYQVPGTDRLDQDE